MQERSANSAIIPSQLTVSQRRWWLGAALIAGLAFAASANSLRNGFVYDDVHAIQEDPRSSTLDGWWKEFGATYWARRYGGDGYRPLTRIAYRLVWAAGNGSPVAFHATNIALHVSGTVAVLWLACALMPITAALVAAALYAVHPVHTEAIANSVGLAELCVLLLVVLGAGLYLHGRRRGPITWRRWTAMGVLYAAACLFKEHAIVFPALLVLAELLVVSDPAPMRQRLKALRLPLLAFTVVALGYLWARTDVVRGVSGFIPAIAFRTLKLTPTDRILTMIGAAPEWFRLLLWPRRLVVDYAPPYIDIAEGPSLIQLPGALLLAGTFGLAVACWRRSPVTSFGILWIAVTLLPASNLLVPSGVLIAERTLMLPSVGAVLAICSVLPAAHARLQQRGVLHVAGVAALAVLIALGIARSVTRNRVWRDNDTLFTQSVKDAPTSYRVHWLLGNHLLATNRKSQGLPHMQEALRLFPYDPMLPFVLADALRERGNCSTAIPLYRWAFELSPGAKARQLGLAICLANTLQFEDAKRAALEALRHGAHYRTSIAVIRAIESARDSVQRARE